MAKCVIGFSVSIALGFEEWQGVILSWQAE
jgi:hypothetical protein